MMLKHGKKAIALAAVCCIGFSACAPQSPAPSSSPTSAPATTAPATTAPVATTGTEAKTPAPVANFNPTGYPVVNEPVTISIFAKHTMAQDQLPYAEMKLFKEISAKTNVNVKWTEVPTASFNEKKSLLFTSGDIPDALWGEGFTDSDILTNTGYLIPLNDLIENYAPNIKKVFDIRPETKRTITSADGNIYSLFRVRELFFPAGRTTWGINKKWLDKLGLAVPTTTDEFYTVLKAFKTSDPNGNGKADEIPLIFNHRMGSGSVSTEADLYPAFGVYDNTSNSDLTYHLMLRDGKVVFTPADNGYKEALKFMNKLYSEGLIDQEVFTYGTNTTAYYAKTRDEADLVGVFVDWTIDSALGSKRNLDDFVQLGAMKGPNGDQGWGVVAGSQIGRNMFEITNKNKYPEATMRWVDEFYSPENSVQAFYGPIDIMIKKEGDKLVALDAPQGIAYGTWKWGQSSADSGPFAALNEYSSFFVPPTQQVLRAAAEANVGQYLQKDPFPNIFFSTEDTAALKKIMVDINNYIETTQAAFVTQGNIDANWDKHITQLEKMKLNEAMAIFQKAYDNYMKTK